MSDLCRVRVADGPHPLWELVLGLNSLQQEKLPPRLWRWRDETRRRMRQYAPGVLRAACALVPPAGNFPDFITPTLDEPGIEAHFESVLALPPATLRADLTRTYRRLEHPPRWVRGVYGHGRPTSIVNILQKSHPLVLDEQVWAEVQREVGLARSRLAEQLLAGGLDALFGSLHCSVRWRWPTLEVAYPYDLDLRLDGRGLLIVPAYFNYGHPITLIDADRTPTLVCPAVSSDGGLLVESDRGRRESIGKLIGRTRAELLASIGCAASTSQLAQRLHVSPAAVSQHTRALREAGLISTVRTGQGVRHTITALGRALLLAAKL
ncbi:helix-turn-helix domain-containing protein [Kribbella hippodromi]|uniref:helix-turn-helix domain-containing protein n=1 Tax=Kribbella hippodromi TaxID=434347 RepID=UPI0031DF8C86